MVLALSYSSCVFPMNGPEIIKTPTSKTPTKPERPTDVFAAARKGELESIKMFMEKEDRLDPRNGQGRTPLHLATMEGHDNAIRFLIEFGAPLDAVDDRGATPLHYAALNGNTNAITVLIENGANANAQSTDGETPMHLAVRNGHINAIQLLAQLGADINLANTVGMAPIHAASFLGNVDVIRLLALLGTNINFPSHANFTPLHLAAFGNRTNAMQSLLDLGATIDVLNKENTTPLGIAVLQGNKEAILWLLENGANIRLVKQFLAASPLLQKVYNAMSADITEFDSFDSTIVPAVLTQLALEGDIMKVVYIIKQAKNLSPIVLHNLLRVLVRNYVKLATTPITKENKKQMQTQVELLKHLIQYVEPREGLTLLIRFINNPSPAIPLELLHELFNLLMRSPFSGRLPLRDRILFRLASQRITPNQMINQADELPSELIEALFRLRQLSHSVQINLLKKAIKNGDSSMFLAQLRAFRANLSQSLLQSLLVIAATGELTEGNINGIKKILTLLIAAGAIPSNTMLNNRPLFDWLQNVILPMDRLHDEDDPSTPTVRRRLEIIKLLGGPDPEGSTEEIPPADPRPLLPVPERIIAPPHISED